MTSRTEGSALLTESQVAERYQLGRSTLANWRSLGRGPKFLRLEGVVRYRASDLTAWESGR